MCLIDDPQHHHQHSPDENFLRSLHTRNEITLILSTFDSDRDLRMTGTSGMCAVEISRF